MIIKMVPEVTACFSNILCFRAFMTTNEIYHVSRTTVIITQRNCFFINVSFSSSVNVFENFAYLFATWFVALRFIISNSIPG